MKTPDEDEADVPQRASCVRAMSRLHKWRSSFSGEANENSNALQSMSERLLEGQRETGQSRSPNKIFKPDSRPNRERRFYFTRANILPPSSHNTEKNYTDQSLQHSQTENTIVGGPQVSSILRSNDGGASTWTENEDVANETKADASIDRAPDHFPSSGEEESGSEPISGTEGSDLDDEDWEMEDEEDAEEEDLKEHRVQFRRNVNRMTQQKDHFSLSSARKPRRHKGSVTQKRMKKRKEELLKEATGRECASVFATRIQREVDFESGKPTSWLSSDDDVVEYKTESSISDSELEEYFMCDELDDEGAEQRDRERRRRKTRKRRRAEPFSREEPVKRKKRKKTAATPSEMPPQLKTLMREATEAYLNGNFEKAVHLLEDIVRQAPGLHDPFHLLGLIYEEAYSDKKRAVDFYLLAAHLVPGDAELWRYIGNMSVQLENISQAIYCYRRCLRNCSGRVRHLAAAAAAGSGNSLHARASVANLAEYEELSHQHQETRTRKGEKKRCRQDSEAEKSFKNDKSDEGEDSSKNATAVMEEEVAYALAACYQQMGEDRKAVYLLQALHELQPKKTAIARDFARCLRALNCKSEAVTVLENAVFPLLPKKVREAIAAAAAASSCVDSSCFFLDAPIKKKGEKRSACLSTLSQLEKKQQQHPHHHHKVVAGKMVVELVESAGGPTGCTSEEVSQQQQPHCQEAKTEREGGKKSSGETSPEQRKSCSPTVFFDAEEAGSKKTLITPRLTLDAAQLDCVNLLAELYLEQQTSYQCCFLLLQFVTRGWPLAQLPIDLLVKREAAALFLNMESPSLTIAEKFLQQAAGLFKQQKQTAATIEASSGTDLAAKAEEATSAVGASTSTFHRSVAAQGGHAQYADLFILLANARAHAHHHAEALSLLSAVQDLPDIKINTAVAIKTAKCLQALDREEEAAAFLQDWLSRSGQGELQQTAGVRDAGVRLLLCEILKRLGRHLEADYTLLSISYKDLREKDNFMRAWSNAERERCLCDLQRDINTLLSTEQEPEPQSLSVNAAEFFGSQQAAEVPTAENEGVFLLSTTTTTATTVTISKSTSASSSSAAITTISSATAQTAADEAELMSASAAGKTAKERLPFNESEIGASQSAAAARPSAACLNGHQHKLAEAPPKATSKNTAFSPIPAAAAVADRLLSLVEECELDSRRVMRQVCQRRVELAQKQSLESCSSSSGAGGNFAWGGGGNDSETTEKGSLLLSMVKGSTTTGGGVSAQSAKFKDLNKVVHHHKIKQTLGLRSIEDFVGLKGYVDFLTRGVELLRRQRRYEEAAALLETVLSNWRQKRSDGSEKQKRIFKDKLEYLSLSLNMEGRLYRAALTNLRHLLQKKRNVSNFRWKELIEIYARLLFSGAAALQADKALAAAKERDLLLENRSWAIRQLLQQPYDFALTLIVGHFCMLSTRWRFAVAEYSRAHALLPDDPFPCLCLALAWLCLSTSNKVKNKHDAVLRGLAALGHYTELRLSSKGHLEENQMLMFLRGQVFVAETLYNSARAYHHSNLLHLSAPLYIRCIEFLDDLDIRFKNRFHCKLSSAGLNRGSRCCMKESLLHDEEGLRQMYTSFKSLLIDRDQIQKCAAHNLMCIWRRQGSGHQAQETLIKYLVWD